MGSIKLQLNELDGFQKWLNELKGVDAALGELGITLNGPPNYLLRNIPFEVNVPIGSVLEAGIPGTFPVIAGNIKARASGLNYFAVGEFGVDVAGQLQLGNYGDSILN